MGQYLIDHHIRDGTLSGFSGGAIQHVAGAPVFRRIGIAIGVDKHQRGAVPVRTLRPLPAVIVGNGKDLGTDGIDQCKGLTIVRQAKGIGPRGNIPDIGVPEIELLLIADNHKIGSDGQLDSFGE